jgi:hypothetical protein
MRSMEEKTPTLRNPIILSLICFAVTWNTMGTALPRRRAIRQLRKHSRYLPPKERIISFRKANRKEVQRYGK